MNPVVSVIIPVYNREQYVCEAIDSVLMQEGVSFEVIVVDDGSTDGTWELLNKTYGTNNLVRLNRQENAGAGAARNAGIKQAKGEFIAFLDSDDLMLPVSLAMRVEALNKYSGAGLIFTDYSRSLHQGMIEEKSFFDNFGFWNLLDDEMIADESKKGVVLLSTEFINLAAVYCCVSLPTVMVRKTVMSKCGGFNESLTRCEDWDLFLRILQGESAVCCNLKTAIVRFWIAGLSNGGNAAKAHFNALVSHGEYVGDAKWKRCLRDKIIESQVNVGHFAARNGDYLEAIGFSFKLLAKGRLLVGARLFARTIIEWMRRRICG